ncbi:MAG: hypothetical protein F4133_12625 [Gammaproteobacteria bacterium]|nr:hypothetical protein [Gammaproteobacteria bacterium]
MDLPRFLFLSLGLTRTHPFKDRKRAKKSLEKMIEPQGSRNCRRNIIVLSGILVLTGLSGADLHSLNLFGIRPASEWGVAVLGAAAVFAQIYWYVQRFQQLSEDGIIENDPVIGNPDAPPQKIFWNPAIRLVRKDADLFSNWVAFGLTVLSWLFIGSWVVGGLTR